MRGPGARVSRRPAADPGSGAIDLNRTDVAPNRGSVPAIEAPAMPFPFRCIDHLHGVRDGPIGNDILGSLPPRGSSRDERRLPENATRSGARRPDRPYPPSPVSAKWSESVLIARMRRESAERPASLAAQTRARIVGLLRAVPIRWRILSIAALNSAVVVVLAVMIWNGAKVLRSAWEDVRQVRESDQILALLESETSRLQNLIHRYINQPSPELFAEILLLREAVLGTLTTRASTDPMLSGSVDELEHVTVRFLDGFGELRTVQATISKTYEEQVLAPAKDMAGLYSIIEGATGHRDAPIWPALGKSREAFTGMLVAANSYYLSLASTSAEDARRNTETIEKTIPVMIELADNELQRLALQRLDARTKALREGLAKLSEELSNRTELLRNTIDATQAEAIGAIDDLSTKMGRREQKAQATFDRALADISRRVLSIAVIFLGIILAAGVLIALSIRLPLHQIMTAMRAIASGDLDRRVQGTGARDEVGAMARAVEVFRENAIAKRQTEDELRTAKEKAESALLELNAAQQNLIDAERLAALGGLVAGVAHEVNNPIGISLTVASSFARRTEMFEAELRSDGGLRRSQLEEFVRTSRDAAGQLVANLHRAGELIQSFKQVAVDRSHAERRQFALGEATGQIIASLKPVLKRAPIALTLDVPEGLLVDGYPGSYGQILTNLFLNAVNHGFADGRAGTISISARARGHDDVEIIFADDGAGMSPDVQRQAFDPFFTTRRNEGGTGLGLHIVYNLVTQQLGGRMMLESRLGQGTTFRIIMPRTAKGGPESSEISPDGTPQWPNRTMSST
jgi:signal transduction histidine kinase